MRSRPRTRGYFENARYLGHGVTSAVKISLRDIDDKNMLAPLKEKASGRAKASTRRPCPAAAEERPGQN